MDEPLAEFMNPKLANSSDDFYASIFYMDENNAVKPLQVLKSNVSSLYNQIKSAVSSNNLGEYCISLGIKHDSKDKPVLLSASKFFYNKKILCNMRKTMVFIVSSRKERKLRH